MATSFGFTPIITSGLTFGVDAANPKFYVSGNTSVSDLTRNTTGGTLVNGVAFSGDSFVFDGVNDYIDCGVNLRFNNTDITYDFWVRATDNSNVYHDIIVQADTNQTNFSGMLKYRSGNNDGKFAVQFQGNTLFSTITGAQLLDAGIINYVGVIKLESGFYNMYLYRNGVLDNQRTTVISTYNMNTWVGFQTRIGGGTVNFPEPWQGNIYSGKVYNRALTASEILQNYNATKWRYQ